MRANLPEKKYFLGKTIPNRPDLAIQEWKDSGNDAHLFRGFSNTLRRDLACKVIPRKNLRHEKGGDPIWEREVHKADLLRNPAVVHFEDIKEWQDSQVDIDCIVLISEFIDGPSLRCFSSDHPGEVSIPFIVNWLETMLNLFNEMKLKDVTHGDFHAGNILVEDRSSFDLLGPKYVFRVTDFGVAEASSDYRFKDDYLQLADELEKLLRKVNYELCKPRDKFIFRILRDHFVSRHLMETDPTRDTLVKQPDQLLKLVQGFDLEYERNAESDTFQLLNPFDYLSCEQIGEAPSLLNALYSDRFLQLEEIENQNNVVVTGPRGCGKTTVFRCLSLNQKMQVKKDDPKQTTYIGVYYRCDDLYFAFPRYREPEREEAIDIPIHFITATLLIRLLEVLQRWSQQNFQEEFNRVESKTSESIWNILMITPPQIPGYRTFKVIVEKLHKERLKATERQRFAHDKKRGLGKFFGPDVLLKVCEVLNSNIPFIRKRPMFFFIDDYSSPKVTEKLQSNLNRLLMQRSSFCFFKLSTESPVSFVKSDIDGKNYVEGREFVLQNLGLVFVHSKLNLKLSFIEDIFRRRLSTTKKAFPAKELVDLVGSKSRQSGNKMALQIREGEKVTFWGKEALCNLCSGDIHYIIGIVGNMVRSCGGPEKLTLIEEEFKIPKSTQAQIIRQEAGVFLKNLRDVPRFGENLVSIVEAFGNVANSHLKYLDSKNEERSAPKQASRIEPFESFSLSGRTKEIYEALLRYSVFIEDFRGKSRRGNIVPRLYLRRFLIPHFNLTFNTRDSIEIEPKDFEIFLLDPKAFEKKHRLKSTQAAATYKKRGKKELAQLKLKLETKNQ